MAADPPFDLVASGLLVGDERAADEVFRRYVRRLIALAGSQFDARLRSKEDPEDIVLSAYRTFFRRQGRSPFDLSDWEGLWALLATITVRKCIDRRDYWRAGRRDVGREWAFQAGPDDDAWWEAIDREPTPEQALILAETLAELVRSFEPQYREIPSLHANGYSTPEIAEHCCCSERTVRRILAEFRARLAELDAEARLG